MKTHTRYILTLLICMLIYPTLVIADELNVQSWMSIEQGLAPSLENGTLDSPFATNRLFAQLLSARNEKLYVEMTEQNDYPVVVLAGFLCLKENFPELTLKSAMRIILAAKRPGLPTYGPVYKYLGSLTNSSDLNASFSCILSCGHSGEINVELMIRSLSYDFVYDWFNSNSENSCAVTIDAILLDRLYGEPSKQKKAISQKMTNRLKQLNSFPGLPRLVFALYTEEAGEELTGTIKACLEAEDISASRLGILIRRRSKETHALLDAGLNVSNERRRQIVDILRRNADNR